MSWIFCGLSGKRGKPVIMNYYNNTMFTLYWIVKRSIAESVPGRASVHTRIAAFEVVSAPEQYCCALLRSAVERGTFHIGKNLSGTV